MNFINMGYEYRPQHPLYVHVLNILNGRVNLSENNLLNYTPCILI